MKIKRFSDDLLAILREGKYLRIRAGSGTHRFIGIWVVVVDDRVFVRSWSVKPAGWYKTFLKEPTGAGAIQVKGEEIRVRTVRAASKKLRDAIDRAYLAKYSTPGSLKYARDLGSAKSRATTVELVPLSVTK